MKDRVTEYARLVVSGVRVACQLHRLACQRHLSNLEKQNTKDFPYYWDIEASERVLEYAETLTISEGEEPRPVRLIGVGMYNLGRERAKQLSLWDIMDVGTEPGETRIKEELDRLQDLYQLDFAGHLEQICRGATLYRTAEYMRKHMPPCYSSPAP